MAMVPLLVIRIIVMIAIRMSGTGVPPIFKAKTSLGFGQGTVVDIRTFMYEVRKQVKMKVSLRRKIHIIALPQGTRNACLSEAQSDTTPDRPSSVEAGSRVVVGACSAAPPGRLPSAELDSPLFVRAFSDIRVDPIVQVDSSTANRTSHTN